MATDVSNVAHILNTEEPKNANFAETRKSAEQRKKIYLSKDMMKLCHQWVFEIKDGKSSILEQDLLQLCSGISQLGGKFDDQLIEVFEQKLSLLVHLKSLMTLITHAVQNYSFKVSPRTMQCILKIIRDVWEKRETKAWALKCAVFCLKVDPIAKENEDIMLAIKNIIESKDQNLIQVILDWLGFLPLNCLNSEWVNLLSHQVKTDKEKFLIVLIMGDKISNDGELPNEVLEFIINIMKQDVETEARAQATCIFRNYLHKSPLWNSGSIKALSELENWVQKCLNGLSKGVVDKCVFENMSKINFQYIGTHAQMWQIILNSLKLDNRDASSAIFELMKALVVSNFKFTNNFLFSFSQQCPNYASDSLYVNLIYDLVQKEVEADWSVVFDTAVWQMVKEQETSETWIEILKLFSVRKTLVSQNQLEYLYKVIKEDRKGELSDMFMNIVQNWEVVLQNYSELIENMLKTPWTQKFVLDIIKRSVKRGMIFTDDFQYEVQGLLKSSPQYSDTVGEIISELPSDQEVLGELTIISNLSQISKVLTDTNESFPDKIKAFEKIEKILERANTVPKELLWSIIDFYSENIRDSYAIELLSMVMRWLKVDFNWFEYIKWNKLVLGFSSSILEKKILNIYQCAADSNFKFPPGSLALLLRATNKDKVVEILNKYLETFHNFWEEDNPWMDLILSFDIEYFNTMEQLYSTSNAEGKQLSNGTLEKIKYSFLNNLCIKQELVEFLYNKMLEGQLVTQTILRYIENWPRNDFVKFWIPIITTNQIAIDDQRNHTKVDNLKYEVLKVISDKISANFAWNREIISSLQFTSFCAFNNYFFPNMTNGPQSILSQDYSQMHEKFEALNWLFTIYEQAQVYEVQEYLNVDDPMIGELEISDIILQANQSKIGNESDSDAIQRICLSFRHWDHFQGQKVSEEPELNFLLLLKGIMSRLACKDETDWQKLIFEVDEFEGSHFSTPNKKHMEMLLSSLSKVLDYNVNNNLDLAKVSGIILMAKKLDKNYFYQCEYSAENWDLYEYTKKIWVRNNLNKLQNTECLLPNEVNEICKITNQSFLMNLSPHILEELFQRMHSSKGDNKIKKFEKFCRSYDINEEKLSELARSKGKSSYNHLYRTLW